MTLIELAALAARHVSEFKRPLRRVCGCGGYVNCPSCGGFDEDWDNSPDVLAMAVLLWFRSRPPVTWHVSINPGSVSVMGPQVMHGTREAAADSSDSVARALLVTLLRSHGIDVSP